MFVVFMYIAAYPFVVALHGSAVLTQKEEEYLDEDDEEASKVFLRNSKFLQISPKITENSLKFQVARDAVTGMRLRPAMKAKKGVRGVVQAVSFHTQSLFFQHIVWLFIVWFLISSIETTR